MFGCKWRLKKPQVTLKMVAGCSCCTVLVGKQKHSQSYYMNDDGMLLMHNVLCEYILYCLPCFPREIMLKHIVVGKLISADYRGT